MSHILLKFLLLLALLSALTTACGAGLLGGSGPLDFLDTATPPPSQQFRLIPATARSGLAALPGYRADLVLDFEGTYQEQPTQGRLEQVIEVTRQPEARHYYLNLAGELPAPHLTPGIAQFFQIGQAVYLRRAGETLWFQFDHPAGSTDIFDLPDPRRLILLPRTVSTPPHRENLADRSVQRYQFSEADLNQPDITIRRAEGSVWVATPGDYVVRYVLSATLRLDQPDPAAHFFDEGHLQLRYGLKPLTTPFTLSISPPDTLLTEQHRLSDLPRLPAARLTTILPALIEYTSPISAISSTLFYRRELSAADWVEETADIFNDKAQLTFVKAGQRLTIIIVPADRPGQVKVSLDLSE